MVRSDVSNDSSEEDHDYIRTHGITTIIDMRGVGDVARRSSGLLAQIGILLVNIIIGRKYVVTCLREAIQEVVADCCDLPGVFV